MPFLPGVRKLPSEHQAHRAGIRGMAVMRCEAKTSDRVKVCGRSPSDQRKRNWRQASMNGRRWQMKGEEERSLIEAVRRCLPCRYPIIQNKRIWVYFQRFAPLNFSHIHVALLLSEHCSRWRMLLAYSMAVEREIRASMSAHSGVADRSRPALLDFCVNDAQGQGAVFLIAKIGHHATGIDKTAKEFLWMICEIRIFPPFIG